MPFNVHFSCFFTFNICHHPLQSLRRMLPRRLAVKLQECLMDLWHLAWFFHQHDSENLSFNSLTILTDTRRHKEEWITNGDCLPHWKLGTSRRTASWIPWSLSPLHSSSPPLSSSRGGAALGEKVRRENCSSHTLTHTLTYPPTHTHTHSEKHGSSRVTTGLGNKEIG